MLIAANGKLSQIGSVLTYHELFAGVFIMRSSTKLLVSTFVFLLVFSLAAQDKQAAQTPLFTAGTSFVQVPVIVQRSGKHVGGLKKDDFVLRQDGKEQPIASFEEIHTG